MTGKAHQFLDQQSKDKPFLLTVSYANPHPPYDGHASQYDEMYARINVRNLGALSRPPFNPPRVETYVLEGHHRLTA